MLVLDSGAVSRLAERTTRSAALITALRDEDLWPPAVLTPVLVEALHGGPGRDAAANRLIKTCDVIDDLPLGLARRAAQLRTAAGRGSAVDALVAAFAEPGGSVLTTDPKDLEALAAHTSDVVVEGI